MTPSERNSLIQTVLNIKLLFTKVTTFWKCTFLHSEIMFQTNFPLHGFSTKWVRGLNFTSFFATTFSRSYHVHKKYWIHLMCLKKESYKIKHTNAVFNAYVFCLKFCLLLIGMRFSFKKTSIDTHFLSKNVLTHGRFPFLDYCNILFEWSATSLRASILMYGDLKNMILRIPLLPSRSIKEGAFWLFK